MANWPVVTSEAEIECDQLSSSHRPIPLPAYDINGKLIPPDRCEAMLRGAIVRVMFTLNHWPIMTHETISSNIFVGDIHSIRILVNSPSQAMSPKKRKTARHDPNDRMARKVGKKEL